MIETQNFEATKITQTRCYKLWPAKGGRGKHEREGFCGWPPCQGLPLQAQGIVYNVSSAYAVKKAIRIEL
jgi:hypothetical protein